MPLQSGEMKEKQGILLKLCESQASHKVFELQYSNTQKLLRVPFIR